MPLQPHLVHGEATISKRVIHTDRFSQQLLAPRPLPCEEEGDTFLSERKHRSKAKLSRSSLKCMLERAVSGPVACLLYQLKRILPPTVDAHCLISQTALHLLVCRHPPYPTYLAVLATGLPPQDPAAHL